MDNPHNVCKACGGASDKPGVCQTENCTSKGQPLTECNCADGKHGASDEQKSEAPQS